MPRIKLRKGSQARFLFAVRKHLALSWFQLSERIKVHPRCLSDWRREKYTLPESAFKRLAQFAGRSISVPTYKVLPDFWSIEKAARKGGLIVARKYGGPGTPEGRRKGGLASQQRRRLRPELYQCCNLRKEIVKPEDSPELAEFIGIVLGDGGINNDYQVVISLHKNNDKQYSLFVCNLIEKLFHVKPVIYSYRSERSKNVIGITVSSISLVEFLLSIGLKKGSKVKQQVEVPSWIVKKVEFVKGCLRGLMETDGGIFYHRHVSHKREYFNIGLSFGNRSLPLLKFVHEALEALAFTPKMSWSGWDVKLYREVEVYRYAKEIKFHNPYHLKRIEDFRRKKLGRGV